MAAATEEIVVKFRTEGGHEIEETFRRAGDAGEQFHQKVTKTDGALGDLRAKSEGRIANNIGAIAQSFSSGASAADVFAGAVTRVSESFRGSLLFASAATVGLGLYETITKIGGAYIKLNDDVARLTRPQGASDFLSTDQIKKNLSDITDEINTIYKQEVQRTHSPLRRLPGQLGQIFAVAGTQLNIGDEDRRDRLRQAAAKSIDQLAEKQIKLNEVQRQAISGSEEQSRLNAAEIQHNERLGELARSTAPVGANTAALGAAFRLLATEKERYELEQKQIRVQYELRGKALSLQERIIDTEKQLLPANEENLKILQMRAAVLRDIADNTANLSTLERREAKATAGQAEATLQRTQFNMYQQGYNPGAFAFNRKMGEQQLQDYNYFRNKYLEQESARERGTMKDVRDPYLKEYEDMIFGRPKNLPPDLPTKRDESQQPALIASITQLVQTLLALPAKVGVG